MNQKRIVLMSSRGGGVAPNPALLEAARASGVIAVANGGAGDHARAGFVAQSAEDEPPLLAVLYEIAHEVSTDELRQAVAQVNSTWSGVPVIAYHPYDTQRREGMNRHDHQTSLRLLKYLGFRAVIEEAGQLPHALRELAAQGNGHGHETETPTTATPAENERGEALLGLVQFPAKLGVKKLRTAFDIVTALHFAGDQRQAAQAALAGLSHLVEADAWAIFQVPGDEDAQHLTLLSSAGRNHQDHAAGANPPPHNGAHDPADRYRQVARTANGGATKTEKISALTQKAVEKVVTVRRTVAGKHVAVVPLVYGEKVYGALEVARAAGAARAFKKSEVELLAALAVPLACALANTERIARAEHLSLTDDMTKLNNARYLRQFLTSEIKRARRYNSPVAVIFLDLDDFKRVNDVHGHLTGSHVLSELATVVLRSVRDTDVVTRYGGDEFVVVLPQSKAEQAVFVAERMREKIATRTFTGGRGLQLRVTASFGVAAFPQNALSPQQLIGCADAAMYQAKAATKNCVRLAPEAAPENFKENAFLA